jgi:predicted nucleic acid-binding protein
MTYLLDSDIFIDYLYREREATRQVEGLLPAGVSISIITLMEAYQGTFARPDVSASQEQFFYFLEEIPIRPFGESAALLCAKLRHDLASQGKRVRSRALDLMIAATAIEHDLILVTRNQSDYRDISDLRIA